MWNRKWRPEQKVVTETGSRGRNRKSRQKPEVTAGQPEPHVAVGTESRDRNRKSRLKQEVAAETGSHSRAAIEAFPAPGERSGPVDPIRSQPPRRVHKYEARGGASRLAGIVAHKSWQFIAFSCRHRAHPLTAPATVASGGHAPPRPALPGPARVRYAAPDAASFSH